MNKSSGFHIPTPTWYCQFFFICITIIIINFYFSYSSGDVLVLNCISVITNKIEYICIFISHLDIIFFDRTVVFFKSSVSFGLACFFLYIYLEIILNLQNNLKATKKQSFPIPFPQLSLILTSYRTMVHLSKWRINIHVIMLTKRQTSFHYHQFFSLMNWIIYQWFMNYVVLCVRDRDRYSSLFCRSPGYYSL